MLALLDIWRMMTYSEPLQSTPKPDPARLKELQEESKRRMMRQYDQESAYMSRLAGVIEVKTPAARAITLLTLLAYTKRDAWRAAPSWGSSVTAIAVRQFGGFDPVTQGDLLRYYWSELKRPELLPLLEQLYAGPANSNVSRDLLLQRIRELDPVKGRTLVLEALRGGSGLGPSTLAGLSDTNLPELDNALAERLERGEYVDSLILRYATEKIYPRVRAAYEKRWKELRVRNLPGCLTALNYYFLRVDPAYGRQEIEHQFADQTNTAPACKDLGWLLSELGASVTSPALEELAIAYLASPSLRIKRGAVEVLGQFGTVWAKKPLWDAFAYCHKLWEGRKEELEKAPAGEDVRLERAFRTALGQAAGWLLTDEDWRRLLGYCVTDWCKTEATALMRQAMQPGVQLVDPAIYRFFGTVGPYRAPTEQMLIDKIRQYPAGTTFRWMPELGTSRNTPDAAYTLWNRRFQDLGMRLDP